MGVCLNKNEEEKKIEISTKKSVKEIMEEENDIDKNEVVHNLDYYQQEEKKELEGETLDDSAYANYSNEIFDLINEIRKDPSKFADTIEDRMENIEEVLQGDKINYIFKRGKIKVRFQNGEPAFRNAAKLLRDINPLPQFKFKKELCVPIPSSENELFNRSYLKNQITNMRQTRKVDAFFKESVKSPTVSVLLMVVDDKKREILLSDEFENIGISSGFVSGNFVAYYAFS